jgi:hypothetical protein
LIEREASGNWSIGRIFFPRTSTRGRLRNSSAEPPFRTAHHNPLESGSSVRSECSADWCRDSLSRRAILPQTWNPKTGPRQPVAKQRSDGCPPNEPMEWTRNSIPGLRLLRDRFCDGRIMPASHSPSSSTSSIGTGRCRRARLSRCPCSADQRGYGPGTNRTFPISAATATTNTATVSGSSESSLCSTNTTSRQPWRWTRRSPTTTRLPVSGQRRAEARRRVHCPRSFTPAHHPYRHVRR